MREKVAYNLTKLGRKISRGYPVTNFLTKSMREEVPFVRKRLVGLYVGDRPSSLGGGKKEGPFSVSISIYTR